MSKDAEYQSLRTELLEVSRRQLNLLTFSFTITAALIGWGLKSSSNNSLIVLIPLIVLGFAGIQLVSHAYSTMRIATYIYCIIEDGDTDLNWETYMRNFRDQVKQPQYRTLAKFSWPSYETLLIIVGWICIGLAFLLNLEKQMFGYELLVSSIVAIVWLGFSVWLWRRMKDATSGELDRDIEGLWKNIASNLNKQ